MGWEEGIGGGFGKILKFIWKNRCERIIRKFWKFFVKKKKKSEGDLFYYILKKLYKVIIIKIMWLVLYEIFR